MTRICLACLLLLAPLASRAQAFEEIVVTGTRADVDEQAPGRFLRRPADFLLLEVVVTNDTREDNARADEIYKTLSNLIRDARRSDDIEVAVVNGDNIVSPLTTDNYRIELGVGDRPDTSAADIIIKTPVRDASADGQVLINRLRAFVDGVSVVGRTELQPVGDVRISVVGPNQYRSAIIELFAEDVREVTAALGSDYRVVARGIDRPVEWYRSGLLELSLYIPYEYSVVPTSISSFVHLQPEY